ncbi:class E sortase [Streptacidiphilus pinicola]|uniref:Class E sortase n=1 Tax=Streptacidiphilus pinicola TaxID=2219663 RepID=A0A2X0K6K5_9ACTN|nr:class E sortase [Streptacidiphilus pinicola]RAG84905.1 class E sortase [Streptacidiphilus pinicola]
MGRLVARTLVELCITVGALIVLLTCYLLFWTNISADQAMAGEMDRLQQQWDQPELNVAPTPTATPSAPAGPAAAPSPTPTQVAYPPDHAFAVLYIPRFGPDWKKPIIEGTGETDLQKGIGHYTGTAEPGQVGNFALAGHRRTWGNPFNDFPLLRPGDRIYVDDGHFWYVYQLDRTPLRTLPTDIHVLDPVPPESGFTQPGAYLTLTTCDPAWGHSHRLIEWGHLVSTTPVSAGTPPGLSG